MAGPVTTAAGGTPMEPIVGIPDEAPAPLASVPLETRRPIIPADGFHDTREVAAAEAGNLPTQAGYPLHPAAQEVLKGLNDALGGIRSWVAWAEAQLGKAATIGAGDPPK